MITCSSRQQDWSENVWAHSIAWRQRYLWDSLVSWVFCWGYAWIRALHLRASCRRVVRAKSVESVDGARLGALVMSYHGWYDMADPLNQGFCFSPFRFHPVSTPFARKTRLFSRVLLKFEDPRHHRKPGPSWVEKVDWATTCWSCFAWFEEFVIPCHIFSLHSRWFVRIHIGSYWIIRVLLVHCHSTTPGGEAFCPSTFCPCWTHRGTDRVCLQWNHASSKASSEANGRKTPLRTLGLESESKSDKGMSCPLIFDTYWRMLMRWTPGDISADLFPTKKILMSQFALELKVDMDGFLLIWTCSSWHSWLSVVVVVVV